MDKNFTVIAFPSNQFGKQEPGANGTEILSGLKYVRPGNNFEPNFPIFGKIDVNGEKENPLYTFLKRSCPPVRDTFADHYNLFYNPMHIQDIRWNFEKFLINRKGKPVKRYASTIHPMSIAKDIEDLLPTRG